MECTFNNKKNICTVKWKDISSQEYIVYGNKRPINNFKILNNDNNYIVSRNPSDSKRYCKISEKFVSIKYKPRPIKHWRKHLLNIDNSNSLIVSNIKINNLEKPGGFNKYTSNSRIVKDNILEEFYLYENNINNECSKEKNIIQKNNNRRNYTRTLTKVIKNNYM